MKRPFVSLEQIEEIVKQYPTPFHIYDEKGIRENAKMLKQAFSWNKGFREYFAVKAEPNPVIMKIFKEEGFGVDCSSLRSSNCPPLAVFRATISCFLQMSRRKRIISSHMTWEPSSILTIFQILIGLIR